MKLMAQYIDKAAVIEWVKKQKATNKALMDDSPYHDGLTDSLDELLSFIDTLEVKDDSLEKFKSLQHISGDLKSTLQDWGYAPNLYYFDGNWHVDWISCEGGDSIKDFTGDTVEEAINKACNWFHSTFCNN